MVELFIDDKAAKNELGKRLKQEIKTRRLKYREISEGTGLSYGFISDLANGNYFASIETLYKLSKFIGFELHTLLNGLEYWIQLSGHKFENVELTQEEKDLYHALLEKEIEIYRSADKYREGLPINTNPNGYRTLPKGIKLSNIKIDDDSMELYGIYKGDTITVSEDSIEPKSERVFVLKYGEKTMVRKVFVDGDYLILIPFSRNKKHEIEKVHKDEVTIMGQASAATIILI
ncbi:MAG: LexA family transcriptional regulator [Clostridiaceae bacterium]|nr:LexA family transcriptional regulator [Clostridiaceae bacterium]